MRWKAGWSASGAREAAAGEAVLDGDAALFGVRRESLVVGPRRHDLVEAGQRHGGPEFAVRAVADGILPPQPINRRRLGVAGQVADVGDMELVERCGHGPLPA